MKKFTCFLLVLLLLTGLFLPGCAISDAAMQEPIETAEPTEPAPTETAPTEPPDAGIASVVMDAPEEVTLTPDEATVIPIRFTGVDDTGAPIGGRICTLKVLRNGESYGKLRVFALCEGAVMKVSVSVPFARYQEDADETLTLQLTYGDQTVERDVTAHRQNWPDEVYAEQSGEKLPYSIDVLRNENLVVVYGMDETGAYTQPVHVFLCSTGRATPRGSYTLGWKVPWRALFGYVYGQYAMHITGNILFHSVPYKRMAKDTMKSEEFNKLGTSASMGCIRMAVQDVKWIYDHCPIGTAVHIYDADELTFEKPEQILLDLEDERCGWDPTDPDPENPWHTDP